MRWRLNWRRDWRREWRGVEENRALVAGYGPAGVGTIVLDLESGFTVTQKWHTDIQKFRSGLERRIQDGDRPQESFHGAAILLDDEPRAARARLARYAALGSQFLLGLPHEAMLLSAPSAGSHVFVSAQALSQCDWSNPGQRVVLVRVNSTGKTESLDAVLQSAAAGVIDVGADPGVFGAEGCLIMPAKAIYLAPLQNFARYPVNAESWQLDAIAAITDFAPQLASVDLSTMHVSLAGNVITARRYGPAGNGISVRLNTDPTYPAIGALDEVSIPDTIIINARGGTTTMGNVASLLSSYSTLGLMTQVNAGYVIQNTDVFIGAVMSGGADAGRMGTGAVLTMYGGDGLARPVWDRPIAMQDTATDSVQAMNEIVEHDHLPRSLGTADDPDYGRAVAMTGQQRADWQWLKLFTATVVGQQKAFWLATWRSDLTFVSKGVGTITVRTDDGSDFAAWYPDQRKHIQVLESDGTVTYARIDGAVDNGDGTRTLTVTATPASSNVDTISWLELCRLEHGDLGITFDGRGLRLSTAGRVVNQAPPTAEMSPTYESDDASVQGSSPREFVQIVYGTVTHRHAFGNRDMAIAPGSVTTIGTTVPSGVYTAIATARTSQIVTGSGKHGDMALTLPIDHALVKRWLALGVPPGLVSVTIWSEQASGAIKQVWDGYAQSMNWDENCTEASFRIPSRLSEGLVRHLPVLTAGRKCPHILYDKACRISRDGVNPDGVPYKCSTTVLAVDGRDVKLDLSNVPVGNAFRSKWLRDGVLKHLPSGEPMSILDSLDDDTTTTTVCKVTMQYPIVGLVVGDAIEVYAGCDWTNPTCNSKFGNLSRHGGFTFMPYKNPFVPGFPVDEE